MTTTFSRSLSFPCQAGVHNDCYYGSNTIYCDCLCHRGGLPPIARTSDIETSHEAAEAITVSGKRGSLCNEFMALIEANPGLTVGELALLAKMESHRVGRRLSDLKNAGRMVYGPPRKFEGINQSTCWAAECQGRLMEE